MEFSVASRLENSTIIAEVTAPEADENTQYAYYLYETQMGILEKRRYTTEMSCSFHLTSPGYYYVKVFVRSWPEGKQGEYVQTSQKTKPVMLYPTKPVLYSQLEEEDFCSVDGTIYDILWDGVHFEFFIHYKPDSAQAVILGTGDVGQHPRPYFSRISWAKELPYTTIYYTDPTSYMPPCTLGWGYGTNDRWYLENIAVLLYQILKKLNISTSDTLFYGSSGGGYTSMLLASMFRSRATVINPQYIPEKFVQRRVLDLKSACLKKGEELLPDRITAMAVFLNENYFPYLHVVQNIQAEFDIEAQLTPFLEQVSHSKPNCDGRLSIDFYSASGGHNTMPNKKLCLQQIADDIARPISAAECEDTPPVDSFLYRMASQPGHQVRKHFLAMCLEHPIPLPKAYFKGDDVIKAAQQLASGTLTVHGHLEAMPYDLDTLDWNVRFSKQPNTFSLYLQGLTPVAVLTDAYTQTRHLPYLNLARQFVEHWCAYEQNHAKSARNKYCWCDHTAGLRAATFIYLGKTAARDGLWEDDFYTLLLDQLNRHGDWLNQDDQYAEHHNHGVMQDQALLYVGVFFQRRDWIAHGTERLMRQVEWAFNSEGVHKENSSGYALMVSAMFQSIGTFLVNAGEQEGKQILSVLDRTKEYLEWCAMPNGCLVQIGDTQLQRQKRVPSPAANVSKFYPEAGMYFYRSKTEGNPADSTWKVLKAGYVTTTHKHCDDCSFVLYSKGHEIFSDGGVYGYARDSYRAYFLSAKAHNTIVVDNNTYAYSLEKSHEIGMLGHQAFPRYDHVRMFHNSYPGVQFIRDFCSADDLTIIMDTLSSSHTHTYSQIFLLSEDMQVIQAQGNEVTIRLADTGYTVRLQQWGALPKLSVLRGALDVPDYGLISRGTNHMDVTTTLKFDLSGTDGVFATTITIEDPDGFVRLGENRARSSGLCFDAEAKTFTLEDLTIPCRRPLPEH